MGLKKPLNRVDKEIMNAKYIDLILTDGFLIKSTGWELVEEFRKKWYNGKVIYVGAAAIPENKKDLFDADAS